MANCLNCIHQEVCRVRMVIFNISNIPCNYETHKLVGEWIEQENGIVVCSRCTKIKRDFRAGHDLFCNACGADMRKEGDKK